MLIHMKTGFHSKLREDMKDDSFHNNPSKNQDPLELQKKSMTVIADSICLSLIMIKLKQAESAISVIDFFLYVQRIPIFRIFRMT